MTTASMVKVVASAHQSESVNGIINKDVWGWVEDGILSRPSNNEWVFYVSSLITNSSVDSFPNMVKHVLVDTFDFEVEIIIL
jgi:hypothetical protein